MGYNGSLQIDGLNRVCKQLQRAQKEIVDEAFKELQAGAQDIVNEGKENLRKNGNNTTGLLRASGKVQKVGNFSLDAGFFDKSNRARGYSYYLEFGRRSGRMPPPDEIEAWLKKKHSRSNKSLNAIQAASVFSGKSMEQLTRQAAWAIAKGIAKKGTRPHPFLKPAIKANERKILKRMRTALQRKMR